MRIEMAILLCCNGRRDVYRSPAAHLMDGAEKQLVATAADDSGCILMLPGSGPGSGLLSKLYLHVFGRLQAAISASFSPG